MYVWDDRWLWIDARRSTNINDGWEWEYTIEGKMSGSSTERELFDTLKSFYKESQMYTAENATSKANSRRLKFVSFTISHISSKTPIAHRKWYFYA